MRDPVRNVVRRILENTCGQSGAASEMSEVGADVSLRHAVDHVAARAWAARENFRASRRDAIALRRVYRSCELGLIPRCKIFRGIDEHSKAHVGMRETAEFCALSRVLSRGVRDKRELVDLAGHDVALTAELRHPKTVDDIARLQLEPYWPVDWNVQLVAGLDAVRILKFPPPLIGDDLDFQCDGRCDRRLRAEDRAHSRNRDHQQDERWAERPGDFE